MQKPSVDFSELLSLLHLGRHWGTERLRVLFGDTQQDLHPLAFWLRPQESPWVVSLGHWNLTRFLPLAERDLEML